MGPDEKSEIVAAINALTAAIERGVVTQELILKLMAVQANVSINELRGLEEEAAAPGPPKPGVVDKVAGQAPAPMLTPNGFPVPISLIAQSPDDIALADAAFAHAAQHYGGAEKVPADLDLYGYAEAQGVQVDAGPQIEEPSGVVGDDWGPR